MHLPTARSTLATIAVTVVLLTSAPVAQASVQGSTSSCAKPDGRVSASVVSGGELYIGGSFAHVTDLSGASKPRAGLAAIDLGTCDLLPWSDNTNGKVYALTAAGGTVYVGGTFTSVDGQPHARIAALNAADGTLLPFNANVNKPVNALTTSGLMLYAGGTFTQANGVSRAHLAAFDLGSGSLETTWKPTTSGAVRALTPSPEGARIYVGGAFTVLDGSSAYPFLGAVDPISGDLDSTFVPNATFTITSLADDYRGLYAGGGGAGGHLVIWNADGSLQRPVYQTDGNVQTVALSGNSLYAGGHFDNYCIGNTGSGAPFICDNPLRRKKLFEVNLDTGALTNWAPTLNSSLGVWTETMDGGTGTLYVGGDFTSINGVRQAHLGAFAPSS